MQDTTASLFHSCISVTWLCVYALISFFSLCLSVSICRDDGWTDYQPWWWPNNDTFLHPKTYKLSPHQDLYIGLSCLKGTVHQKGQIKKWVLVFDVTSSLFLTEHSFSELHLFPVDCGCVCCLKLRAYCEDSFAMISLHPWYFKESNLHVTWRKKKKDVIVLHWDHYKCQCDLLIPLTSATHPLPLRPSR